jgi:hypothetical protein
VRKCRSTWRCADSELVDIDPASNCCYVPVDLNNAHLLAQNGLQPSEANPQFHQQMVYAVAMRTIARFERALARRALWAEHVVRGEDKEFVSADFVQRLRIYPHALREENAYYSRNHMALLFGYFNAQGSDVGTTDRTDSHMAVDRAQATWPARDLHRRAPRQGGTQDADQ